MSIIRFFCQTGQRVFLEGSRLIIIEADNGLDGVEKATAENMGLRLIDKRLRDIDNLAATKRTRKNETDAHIGST